MGVIFLHKTKIMLKYILIIILFFPVFLLAQDDETTPGTFSASIIAGANAAQIDGDDLAGFNKIGYVAGGRVEVGLGSMWAISMDILYSVKGSRATNKEFSEDYDYTLSSVEVPVSFYYIDGNLRFHAGLGFDRLVQVNNILISDIDETELRAPFYRKNNIFGHAGATYFITDHIGLEANFGYSFNSIVEFNKADDPTPYPAGKPSEPQVHKWLSFRGIYMF